MEDKHHRYQDFRHWSDVTYMSNQIYIRERVMLKSVISVLFHKLKHYVLGAQ